MENHRKTVGIYERRKQRGPVFWIAMTLAGLAAVQALYLWLD